jgi:hypothetical protein
MKNKKNTMDMVILINLDIHNMVMDIINKIKNIIIINKIEEVIIIKDINNQVLIKININKVDLDWNWMKHLMIYKKSSLWILKNSTSKFFF